MQVHDETRTLRRRLGEVERAVVPSRAIEGCPAVAGVVANGGSIPTALPGQFLLSPVRLGGAIVEGGDPDIATSPGPKFSCTVFGIDVPAVGDMLIARRVGGRWVADTNSGSSATGTTVVLSGCEGTAIPTTFTQTVIDIGTIMAPTYGTFQNCTYTYGVPPWFPAIGPSPTHYSNETFMDTIAGAGVPFRYNFVCGGGTFAIRKIYYPASPPLGHSELAQWHFNPPPLDGNTETPFLMHSTELTGTFAPQCVLTG